MSIYNKQFAEEISFFHKMKHPALCEIHKAGRFFKNFHAFGRNNFDISTCSSVSSLILRDRPPAYPVRLPSVPTTLWHGIRMEMVLCPTAPPTACANLPARCGSPESCAAISPYVIVFPYGIVRRISQTRFRNGVVFMESGGRTGGFCPLK